MNGLSGFLTESCKLTKVADHSTAATTDVTSASVDMEGWDGVVFFTSYGTAAANNLIHIEQSSDDGSVDTFTDVAGSEVNASGASDEDQFVDILRPQERYLRCIGVRGTSSTLESIWALQYKGRKVPFASAPNLTSGTIYGNRLTQPIAGTK